MYRVVQEIDDAKKVSKLTGLSPHLSDKVLLQTVSTDIWRATTTIYADYSAEVVFLFLAFGIFNNRLNTYT